MEIGKRYKVWSKVKINSREYLYTAKLVHVFPAYEPPDATLTRVYAAGPAGEPPPAHQYNISYLDRLVMVPEDDSRNRKFVIHGLPNKYIEMEALHDNP